MAKLALVTARVTKGRIMASYKGFRRPERFKEMVYTRNVYGPHPYVDTKHHEARGGISVDTRQQEQGGQGKFAPITDTDGGLGVKQFNLVGIDSAILKERASRLSKALEEIASWEASHWGSLLLFNQLNIPARLITRNGGELWGLYIPVAPSSCYITTNFMGKSVRKEVLLRHVISCNEHVIRRERNSDDPLSDPAKWSILDSLCGTIAALHDLHLVHLDISGSNVLVRWSESHDPKVYVIDAFNGYSDTSGNRELGHMLGNVYCPTSVQRCDYTPASDVYCLAWWVMHLAVAKDPSALSLELPNFTNQASVKKNLFLRHEYVIKHLPNARRKFPKWLYETLDSCLVIEPKDRPTSRELSLDVHDYWMNFGDAR